MHHAGLTSRSRWTATLPLSAAQLAETASLIRSNLPKQDFGPGLRSGGAWSAVRGGPAIHSSRHGFDAFNAVSYAAAQLQREVQA
jgi:hypothetical protein